MGNLDGQMGVKCWRANRTRWLVSLWDQQLLISRDPRVIRSNDLSKSLVKFLRILSSSRVMVLRHPHPTNHHELHCQAVMGEGLEPRRGVSLVRSDIRSSYVQNYCVGHRG
jgi:hypothetical protein